MADKGETSCRLIFTLETNERLEAIGEGEDKKSAREDASRKMLSELRERGLLGGTGIPTDFAAREAGFDGEELDGELSGAVAGVQVGAGSESLVSALPAALS